MNPYVPTLWGLDAHGGRKLIKYMYMHTHAHTHIFIPTIFKKSQKSDSNFPVLNKLNIGVIT